MPTTAATDTPRPFVIYAAFIVDGYVDAEHPAPYEGPGEHPEEGSAYWFCYRNAELDCPDCNGGAEPPPRRRCETCDGSGWTVNDGGKDAPCPDCRDGRIDGTCATCDGSGHVYGETFQVVRYVFPSEGAALAAWELLEDDEDGDDRAATLETLAARGACDASDIFTWTPDHG